MDPFEEFEIKPLSDGLGFHRKATSLSEQIKKSGLSDAQNVRIPSSPREDRDLQNKKITPQTFADLLKALDAPVGSKARANSSLRGELLVTEALPAPGQGKRAGEMEIPRRPIAPPDLPSLTPKPISSPLSKVVETVGIRRGASDSPMRMLERAPSAIPAAILDGVVVFALALVFLVVLMTVTHVDLAALIFQAGLDVPTKLAFAALYGSVLLMYVVISRSFFGRTLGEWTFDYQMGDDRQHQSAFYPLQILWRSFLNLATGLIVLPLLSTLFQRDLLAPLTGLQLYRQR